MNMRHRHRPPRASGNGEVQVSRDEFLKRYRPQEYARREAERNKPQTGTGLVDEFLVALRAQSAPSQHAETKEP